MKQGLKIKAIKYRRRGYSYAMIKKEIGISKSTLSGWLQEIPFKPNQTVLKRIGEARTKSAQSRNEQKLHNIEQARQEAKIDLGTLSHRDLFLLGIGLYMGEGTKSSESIRVINSDPKIILLTLKWLKDICGLKNNNFRITVFLYPDLNEKLVKNYWSRLTGLPLSQFCKTQIDSRTDKKSKKKHKLPYGTAQLSVRSNGQKQFGVHLHRKILGWIDHANVLAGIV